MQEYQMQKWILKTVFSMPSHYTAINAYAMHGRLLLNQWRSQNAQKVTHIKGDCWIKQ